MKHCIKAIKNRIARRQPTDLGASVNRFSVRSIDPHPRPRTPDALAASSLRRALPPGRPMRSRASSLLRALPPGRPMRSALRRRRPGEGAGIPGACTAVPGSRTLRWRGRSPLLPLIYEQFVFFFKFVKNLTYIWNS